MQFFSRILAIPGDTYSEKPEVAWITGVALERLQARITLLDFKDFQSFLVKRIFIHSATLRILNIIDLGQQITVKTKHQMLMLL